MVSLPTLVYRNDFVIHNAYILCPIPYTVPYGGFPKRARRLTRPGAPPVAASTPSMGSTNIFFAILFFSQTAKAASTIISPTMAWRIWLRWPKLSKSPAAKGVVRCTLGGQKRAQASKDTTLTKKKAHGMRQNFARGLFLSVTHYTTVAVLRVVAVRANG